MQSRAKREIDTEDVNDGWTEVSNKKQTVSNEDDIYGEQMEHHSQRIFLRP